MIKKVNSEMRIGAIQVAHEFNDKGEFIYNNPTEKIMNMIFPNHNSL